MRRFGSKKKKARAPNYIAKLTKLTATQPIIPGTIRHVDIYHDDWCAFYRGKPCNCDPDVSFRDERN